MGGFVNVTCDNCGIEFDKSLSEIKRTCGNFCSRGCAGTYNGKLRSGPYKHSVEIYELARWLRKNSNYSYGAIAKELGLPYSTVRNWVCDIDVSKEKVVFAGPNGVVKEKPFKKLKTNSAIRKRLIKERGHKCELCGLTEWLGEPIWLEIHHVNGKENTKGNILLLCLNCHATTDGYRNKTPT